MPGWVGRTLGKSSVELLLARDDTAEVYLGRHRGLQRAVAIRILTDPFADDPAAFADFQRQARDVAGLQNPHIAGLIESGRSDGYAYVVMEYVPGTSLGLHLKALAASQRKFDTGRISQLLHDIADGIDYAHQRGVIHRALRPSAILLTSSSTPVEAGKSWPPDFRAVLTDFAVAPKSETTPDGLAASAAAYLSPEQAAGQTPSPSTDIYALGLILYELIAGRVPFTAESASAVFKLQQTQPPPNIEGLTAPLQSVLQLALQKEPAARYAQANELVAAYDAATSETPAASIAVAANSTAGAGLPAPSGSRRMRNWASTAVVGIAILGLAAILGSRALFPLRSGANAPSTTAVALTEASEEYGPVAGDPIGLLRFQDGAAQVDEVSFNASAMPTLEAGRQYEVWLLDASGEERRSVGYLKPNPDGTGTTSLVDPDGRNLLGLYDSIEITLEPDPDPSPNPAGVPLFSARLPDEGLLHVRHLLVSFSRAPNAIGLVDGLIADARILDETGRTMLSRYEAGDEAGTRANAEAMLNVLVGSQSPEHSDWDHDGQIADPGDGYGLLLNGDNSGYIQGSIAHAGFAASSPTATTNMQSHGDHVIVSARNLEAWAPQLRDLLKQILSSPFDAAMGGQVRQAVALSQNMLAGTDLNGNERIEAIAGEGGAETAYQHALYMADIVITQSK